MRKPKLTYDMISSLTTEQLKQLIKSEGKIANRRLQNLRKSGYYDRREEEGGMTSSRRQ